jgi:hypothetical protein
MFRRSIFSLSHMMNHLSDTTDASRLKLDRRRAMALLALPGVWLTGASQPGVAAERVGPCRVEGRGLQEFWIVNTRRAPTCRDLVGGVDQIEFSKRSDDHQVRLGRDEFMAAIDPSLPTVVYVHGNSLDADEAVTSGERLIDGIGAQVAPYRFILWSWPADRISRMNYPDNARVKSARGELQGYYLAWLIDQIDPGTRFGLVGYSLGALTVTAALDGLARGEVAGQPLIEIKHVVGRPVQAALLAAAEENNWLWPDGRHGLALTQVDRALVTINPRDRLLRHYIKLWSADALGKNGISEVARLGELQSKVQQFVVTPWLGRAHRWVRYTQSAAVMSLLRPYLFDFDAR